MTLTEWQKGEIADNSDCGRDKKENLFHTEVW
jgi:hypothetical protein